ncbi:hypothetical protein GGTG_02838 [Gaeumannomyces tritici R3-111a-1]|uniref:Uncharacterized protein n=1 Tax=Gaeumannomyces tritici (strain R3-111a-1) TaxID=644352 RepID=J3NNI2_GAET3|nr:hypothetical protein GGTG_02838 [Gaeumannomyces tritici R3-111a-1]EJT77733.1 hypothetical protein GGTG_02838 [Gaeumannomyces tritici R3-111a-1]
MSTACSASEVLGKWVTPRKSRSGESFTLALCPATLPPAGVEVQISIFWDGTDMMSIIRSAEPLGRVAAINTDWYLAVCGIDPAKAGR